MPNGTFRFISLAHIISNFLILYMICRPSHFAAFDPFEVFEVFEVFEAFLMPGL